MFDFLNNIKFANPEFFWLFIVFPFIITWYIFQAKKRYAPIRLSTTEFVSSIKPTARVKFRHLPFIMRMLTISFIIIVLARPQTSSSHKTIKTEGIDIVISLDISSSMLAEDFKPNRLEAAKKTAIQFIDNRINDRIGLVVFSSQSFTQCPITIDHSVLKNLFSSVKSGMIEDGTAIGMGLATAVDRLKDSKAKSKVIILLTDGVNNRGLIAPMTAAEIAATFNIRVYTIGVGSRGMAPYPVKTPFGTQYVNMEVEIDEALLKEIAKTTGGKYFRATNNKALENIYNEIDKLEKTIIDEMMFHRKSEEYLPFGIAAGLLLFTEIFLILFVYRKFP